MSKVIESPTKYFPGTVTLSNPLTYPQVIAVEDAIAEAQALTNGKGPENVRLSKLRYAMLKGICSCVEEWNLEGQGHLTPENFPATPRNHADELAAWLQEEVLKLFAEQENVPNE